MVLGEWGDSMSLEVSSNKNHLVILTFGEEMLFPACGQLRELLVGD